MEGGICGEASDTHTAHKARGGSTTIPAAVFLLLWLCPTLHPLRRTGATARRARAARAILPPARLLFLELLLFHRRWRFSLLLHRRISLLFGIGRASYVAYGLSPKLKLCIRHEQCESFGVVRSSACLLRKLGHQSLAVGESYADTFDH